MAITIKSEHEIELMREAGKKLAIVHAEVRELVRPGITTKILDEKAYETILKLGGVPNFLHLYDYPATICASKNEVVVHGVPDDKTVLLEGDIISIDMGLAYQGYHSDAARTYGVGQVSEDAQKLMDVTKQSFFEGMKFAKEGYHLHDISAAIQKYAESFGYGVVRDMVGHGIGTKLHEDPEVPNFKIPGKGPKLRKGMTLAVEPMINMGTWQIDILEDGMTALTKDRKKSAHYENTIVITEGEPEILTLYRDGVEV